MSFQEGEIKEMKLAKKASKTIFPVLKKYYRAKFIGLENIPEKSFLAIGNHLGVYFIPEAFLWLGKYHTLKDKPPMQVLVHKVFHNIAHLVRLPEDQFGIIEATPENALKSLKSGNALTVFPGGDRENNKPFKDRNKIEFYGHHGYIQMALKAGVPILPVVGVGGGETLFVLSSGERIARRTGLTKLFKLHSWPIYWSFPFGLHVGHGPKLSFPLPSQITISILPPYSLKGYKPEDADNEEIVNKINADIVAKMQKEMDRLSEGRIPIIGKL